jgi:predicted HTH transcriptional regulator
MKPSSEWSEKDLLELISSKYEESLQLDFKRAESLDSSEKKKIEISKDVSAFANSAGGTIVYGIAESNQEPRCAESLSPIDPSKYNKEWVEQIVNSRIQPRIQGVLINPVPLAGGKVAYVVCIPQSTTAHQASDHKYYKRFNLAIS